MSELAELTDVDLAATLATRAGEILVSLRDESGYEGHVLGDAGDRAADDYLHAALAQARPQDCVLSEESTDDLRRLTADRVWIIDPLDGTREYRSGRADWAVHVALWQASDDGGDLTDGAVSLPMLRVTYRSNGETVTPTVGLTSPRLSERPRVVVSGSRPPEFAQAVAHAIGGDVVPMGSAGAKAMAVVRSEADVYVHGGGQYEWDSAAPVVVAQSQGLWCSRIDGSPLRYNQRDVYLPDLIIARPEWRHAVQETITKSLKQTGA